MTSAAVIAAPAPRNKTLALYFRSVWLKLAAGSLFAGFCAWLIAFVAPLRQAIIISWDGHALGLSVVGILVVAAPIVLWIFTRLFVRAPTALISGALFWTFAATVGAGANALFLLFAGDSTVSAFVLAAMAFSAVALAQRLSPYPLAGIAAAGVFAATGLCGAYVIARFLPSTRPFIIADAAAILLIALIVALRSRGLARTHETYAERRGWRALVDYGALYAVALADLAPDRRAAPAQT